MVKLEEYNGKFSIVSGWLNKEGEFKPNWIRAKRYDRDRKEWIEDKKDSPLKIYLGDIEAAQNILTELRDSLLGGDTDNYDIPF